MGSSVSGTNFISRIFIADQDFETWVVSPVTEPPALGIPLLRD